jgi:nitrogen regulatory protein PII
VQPVKRVEIVVDALDLDEVLRRLEAVGMRHYTVVRGVGGRGERGARGGDPFSGAFDNVYVLLACEEPSLGPVVEQVRGLLEHRGGMCLVSDALWVRH